MLVQKLCKYSCSIISKPTNQDARALLLIDVQNRIGYGRKNGHGSKTIEAVVTCTLKCFDGWIARMAH
jgi:hypothetical protein